MKKSLTLVALAIFLTHCIQAQVKRQFKDGTFAQTTVVIKDDKTKLSDVDILNSQFDMDEVSMGEVIRITTEQEKESSLVKAVEGIAEIDSQDSHLAKIQTPETMAEEIPEVAPEEVPEIVTEAIPETIQEEAEKVTTQAVNAQNNLEEETIEIVQQKIEVKKNTNYRSGPSGLYPVKNYTPPKNKRFKPKKRKKPTKSKRNLCYKF